MIRNFLLITLRSMAKNKIFIVINVLGLAIAIGCCIVGFFAWEHDAGFDAMHTNADRIYRVSQFREFNNREEKFGFVPLPLPGVVKENIKDVEKLTRYHFSWSNLKREDDLFSSRLAYVDPAFFEMFSFHFIEGDVKDINDKSSILISEKLATTLFGSPSSALGKSITQVYGTELKELRVAAVYKNAPMNSSWYNREAFLNFENMKEEFKDKSDDDWRKEVTLFLQISDSSRIAQIEKQLQPFIEFNNKVRPDFVLSKFFLDPLVGMGHADRQAEVRTWTWSAPPQSAIIGSAVMGVLILLIACFNLTNTSMAISSRRLKEIGIRKVMGSMRNQLVVQFLSETLFIVFVALLLGVVIGEYLVGGWNLLWEFMRLETHYLDHPRFVFFLVFILVFTAVLAGAYPAFYISKFEPISILKGKLKFGGSNYFSWFLLGAQFSISLIAIVAAFAFWQNARYQNNYDLGFNIKGSIITWLNSSDEVLAYKNALSENPDITSMAGANSGIFSNRSFLPVKHESKEVEVYTIAVGDNYLKTMNLKLKDGREFMPDSETDKKESVIISEKLAAMFGWEKALGKEIIIKDSLKVYVIGVVKDVYTMGLWRELDPLMIRYIGPEGYSQLVVSGEASKVAEINKYMESKWKTLFPYRLYNGNMLANDFDEVTDINSNILIMFAFLGFVAMLLSATGLFTLVSLNIIKRMKEIGVRKVLGASIANITRIINTEFFVVVLIASVIGCTLSYFAIDALMGSIWRYYQSSSLLTFSLAVLVMLLICLVSIGYKVYTAASTNPVNTLRDE